MPGRIRDFLGVLVLCAFTYALILLAAFFGG
jgi:hypothetical protein